MDNQNNPNNQTPPNDQNQQEGYTNFNNYQPNAGQNAQPPMPPQPGQQIPYQAQPIAAQKDNSTTMGVLSIVFSALSLFICPYIFGAVGVVLGIVGVSKKKNSVVSWIGLVLGIVALIINIVWAVYQATHPEIQQQMLNNLSDMMGSSTILFR